MPITVICAGCGKRYRVADHLIGQSRPCVSCGNLMTAEKVMLPELRAQEERPEEAAVVEVLAEIKRKTIGPFGVGSFGFAMLALLLCWIPFINVASFPLALIGGVLSLLGIGLSIVGKRHALAWPASSLLMCLLAVFISHQVWLGMWMAFDRVTGVVDRVEAAATKAAGEKIRIEIGPANKPSRSGGLPGK